MERLTGCGKGSSTGPAVVVIGQLWKRSKRRKDGESFQWARLVMNTVATDTVCKKRCRSCRQSKKLMLIADESGGGETSGRK